MDTLIRFHGLRYALGAFLLFVVVIPFVVWEIRKHRTARRLIHQIVPVSKLTEADIQAIQSRHPSGQRMYPKINMTVCVGCGTCVIACKAKKTLALIGGKSTLLDPRACDGCGECESACPTGANQLVEYGQKIKVRCPDIDANYETNIPGIYIIGTLSGAGLIKETINQGRAVLNSIMRDVFPGRMPHIVIVGAGPAGLSAYLSCRKFGLSATCLEKEAAANTIRNFPKNKIVMAEPVDMPLFGPLWVGDTTREKLLEVWDRILHKTGALITTGANLEMITPKDGRFVVSASGREYIANKVILALGMRGEPRKLNVPGEKAPHVFYSLIDAAEFKGGDIAIVGGGDAGLEAALALANQGCRITLVVLEDGFPFAKPRNREKIEAARQRGAVDIRFQSVVKEIRPGTVRIAHLDKIENIKNDFVFIMVGGELPFPLLEKIGIRIVEKTI
jgi:thioredoxin reductase (NADPH)